MITLLWQLLRVAVLQRCSSKNSILWNQETIVLNVYIFINITIYIKSSVLTFGLDLHQLQRCNGATLATYSTAQ